MKQFQKEGHEIILSLDGNEAFTNAKKRWQKCAKMYKEFKLYDPFVYRHNDQRNSKSII